jgi:hypothetical protein
MPRSVSVLLLDDGELDDVQEMLEHAGIPFGRVRGASIVPGMQGPTDLLIATPRRIHAVADVRDGHPDDSAPVRIVITEEDSNSLRHQLRKVGFDYIVRRPVHPEALRLLIFHALYSGEERRTEPRVGIGVDVTFTSGLIPRRGILADLSTRGCRLLLRRTLEAGKRVKLHIPEALGASEQIALRGRVVRSSFENRGGETGFFSVGILFEKVSNVARQEIEWIIEECSKGPLSLGTQEAREGDGTIDFDARVIREIPAANLKSDPRYEQEAVAGHPIEEDEFDIDRIGASSTSEQSPDSDDTSSLENRRQIRRAAFAAKVPAFGSRALRVLVGRDLSIEGMRVEASPELEVGDRLHLAIYGDPEEEPFLIWATVDRDDAERGMAISFDELHPVIAQKLERLIGSLPSVESLHDEESEAMGTVIGEMLPPEGT